MKAHNFSQNWRKRSRQQFKEARARVLMFLLILLWLRAGVLGTWYKQMFLLLRVSETDQPARAQLEHFPSMKARPSNLRKRNLVLTTNAFPGISSREMGARTREHLLGNERSRSDRSPLASNFQRAFNAAWSEYRSGCRT